MASTTTTTTTTTVLRVKRRRHVAPLPSLQLDLDGGTKKRARTKNDEITDEIQYGLSRLLHQSTYVSVRQEQRKQEASRTTALWKRLGGDVSSVKEAEAAALGTTNKRIRFVDARLDDDDDEAADAGHVKKRRRLALTLLNETRQQHVPSNTSSSSKPSPNSKQHAIILDPLSRLVDDSLQRVFSQIQTVSQHLDFIETDPRLLNNAGKKNWLTWSTQNGGNILHAAALHNDVQATRRVLHLVAPTTQHYAETLLLKGLDSDGRTPYEVAQLAGHEGIARLLEESSDGKADTSGDAADEENDFVYDVFCLQEEDHEGAQGGGGVVSSTNTSIDESDLDDREAVPTVELRGGIGYWNEQGELILEAMDEDNQMDSSVHLDDDADSNCEDYEGNDYPDEEHIEDDDPWDDDDSFNDENDRHRPIYMTGNMSNLGLQLSTGKVGLMHDSMPPAASYNDCIHDDDDYYDNVDVDYGLHERPSEHQKQWLYAYDADLDDTDNYDSS